MDTMSDRKIKLKLGFYFDCQCEGCKKEYMTVNEAKIQYLTSHNQFSFWSLIDRVWKHKSLNEWKECFKFLEEKYQNYDNFVTYCYRIAFLAQMEFDVREYE